MCANNDWMFIIGAICYGLAFLVALFTLRKANYHKNPTMLVLLIGAFVIQSLALYFRGLTIRAFPLVNPFEILQVLAWSAVALDLILRPLFRLKLLNLFASGLACILALFSFINPGWDYAPPVSPISFSPWVGFHAALAVFSYGIFAILGLTSMMYLIQHRGLAQHRGGTIFNRLPAIRQLDNINSKLIIFGISVLSISVAVGTMNWLSEPRTVSITKILVAIGIWLAYIIVLWLRKTNRLIAAPYAWACLMLFLCVLLSLWPLTHRAEPLAPVNPASLLDDANN